MEEREQNELGHLFMGDLEMENERGGQTLPGKTHRHHQRDLLIQHIYDRSELYLSVRRRSSALECVSSIHRRVTPRHILVCVISKRQTVMETIAEVQPRRMHAQNRNGCFEKEMNGSVMTTFRQMLLTRE